LSVILCFVYTQGRISRSVTGRPSAG